MLRREIEQGKKQQVELCQNNSALQSEIDSMNSHIRIVTHQNEELTREID